MRPILPPPSPSSSASTIPPSPASTFNQAPTKEDEASQGASVLKLLSLHYRKGRLSGKLQWRLDCREGMPCSSWATSVHVRCCGGQHRPLPYLRPYLANILSGDQGSSILLPRCQTHFQLHSVHESCRPSLWDWDLYIKETTKCHVSILQSQHSQASVKQCTGLWPRTRQEDPQPGMCWKRHPVQSQTGSQHLGPMGDAVIWSVSSMKQYTL